MSNQIIMPSVGLEGRFRIEIRRNGVLVKEIPWFKNVITNGGFALWYTQDISSPKLWVGSGNQTPSAADTGLAVPMPNPVSMHYTATTKASAAPWYTENTYRAVFPMNTITGNISELGVSDDQNHFFSRTLIKDASGNPTVISVIANEEVTIFYSIRQYEDLSDVSGSFNLGNETYNYTSYAMMEPDYIGCINQIFNSRYGYISTYATAETEAPANPRQNATNSSSAFPAFSINYGAQSVVREVGNEVNRITSVWFDYSQNATNDLPMKTLLFSYTGNNPRRVVFDPPIPKNNTRKITFVSELSASRY